MESLAAYFHIDRWPPRPDLLFWIALILLAGALLGDLVQRTLRLPRITGYCAAGLLVAIFGKGLGDGLLLGTDRLIVDLALALLLFELGSRVSLRWLRNNPHLLMTSVLESLLGFWAIFATLSWFGFEPRAALAGSALLGVSAAAVIGRVATELKTAGQVTERMLVLSALNTLYAVLLLKLVGGWLHLDQQGDWIQGVGLALTSWPISATSLVLLAELRLSHPALAQDLTPLVLSAIALMALPGPALVQAGLWIAREYRREKN